jgi:hypothetical protein
MNSINQLPTYLTIQEKVNKNGEPYYIAVIEWYDETTKRMIPIFSQYVKPHLYEIIEYLDKETQANH